LVDHQWLLFDVYESSSPPEIAQLTLARKLHVTLVLWLDRRIERNGFPRRI
jgi:hypothetical protein